MTTTTPILRYTIATANTDGLLDLAPGLASRAAKVVALYGKHADPQVLFDAVRRGVTGGFTSEQLDALEERIADALAPLVYG